MTQAGLESEARTIGEQYGWGCEALGTIGYKEWREYLDGRATLAQTVELITRNTRDLAKRQRTWFRRNKDIRWISKLDEAVDLVTTLVSK
jgi:tRNA dimethylallyltransferase